MLLLCNVAVAFNSYFTKSIKAMHTCVFLRKLYHKPCTQNTELQHTQFTPQIFGAMCAPREYSTQQNQALLKCFHSFRISGVE